MKIIAIGDVCGQAGCDILRRKLPAIKKYFQADLIVVNGENAAGMGMAPKHADAIFMAGADVITLGNHAFDAAGIHEYLDERADIVRPLNLPAGLPGRGAVTLDCLGRKVCVAGLMGRAHMNEYIQNDPFAAADALLKRGEADIYVFDFHAQTTSEKKAFSFFVDGRASVVFGTHTHVQTADNQILPGGCGYITDLGMTGAQRSVIGMKWQNSVAHFTTGLRARFESAEEDPAVQGAFFELDGTRCVATERIDVR